MDAGLSSLRSEALGAVRTALVSAENLQLTLKTELSQEEQALTNAKRSPKEAHKAGNEDLKEMLESNKESLKLEAMKRVVGLIAKGKNSSELFPAVVKNVASKNIELKKLVYVYLVRYAEEQQDLALLSISTFQRALKDPNQFIRASALRVLSSIRVPIIVPIMMLAIKEAAADLSPYVRKTSAHAIQKLYSLDPEQKEQLIEVIEKLLKDKSTLVAGSVVMAFEEVCPDRIDLIHKNYRKLCNLLVDVEEWGQVVIISMLTRYARTQFTSPWKEVVMCVAQLYWHLAPKHEVNIVTKSLVRLLRSHREVQYIVLQNIATMSIQRKLEILTNLANEANISTILREFQVCLLFPDITTRGLVSLTALTTYVKSQDKAFAAATIQAIGRCATNISEVTDTCLNGLVLLLSNRDGTVRSFAARCHRVFTSLCILMFWLRVSAETVVAESVVVIKKLLQTQPTQHSEIIKHMAKLFDNITVPMARASILWLMGEYCERVPKIAPDVLRKMAKTFTAEEDIVKLQTVNLAAKLYLTNSKQTKLLTQYILNLGKYDQNYDIRDRTRFIRQLIVPSEKSGALNKYARRILLAPKPAPVLESAFKDRDRFQLGTLSHSLNIKASGYQELSDWPAVAPDQSVRNVEVIEPVKEWVPLVGKTKKSKSEDKFYSDDEEEKEEDGSESSGKSGSESEEESSKESDKTSSDSGQSSSGSEKSSSESESEQKKKKTKKAPLKKNKPTAADSDSDENGNGPVAQASSSSPESSSGSETDSEDDSDSDSAQKKKSEPKSKPKVEVKSKKEVSLLDLDDFSPAPTNTPKSSVVSLSLLSDLEGLSLSNISSTMQCSDSNRSRPCKVSTLKLISTASLVCQTDSSPFDKSEEQTSPAFLTRVGTRCQLRPASTEQCTLTPGAATITARVTTPSFGPVKTYELLHHMTGKGLSAKYHFPRQPCLYQPSMVAVQVTLTNGSDHSLEEIHIGDRNPASLNIHCFNTIERLEPEASVTVSMGIDFSDSTQAANFQLCTKEDQFSVSIQPAVGELLMPSSMTEQDFCKEQGKLLGMNETSATITMATANASRQAISKQVLSVANVGVVTSSQNDVHRKFLQSPSVAKRRRSTPGCSCSRRTTTESKC
ncbi:AP-3 complex subunit beta-1 [Collichthys lucidus]|uniref:AP-3 complex subunit beta n=1 Tax=Collichthys lucidus TaxID=240159 RepID=A0A4U5VAR2_COLLU|nr:AP-3 complex subunit beta-1 [Collichthys lucidus]